VVAFVHELAKHLASFDWRTSAAPGLSENDRAIRTGFRGAGGYKELRRQLLRHVSQQGGTLGQLASEVTSTLGLDD